ncbi:MAG: methionyl-tRNA formyltransferase [Candidatus Rokuibacteriota bacterium]|nr:MAG: methionyl-tRNA formyltransferase [Candidatus Rokubacteria bacterium]
MRVLFYGTPRFALPTLDALLAAHEVVGVVTQPDRPAGRGQRVAPPPVKERAVAAGIPVLQPERLRDPRWLDPLEDPRGDAPRGGHGLHRAVRRSPARSRAPRRYSGQVTVRRLSGWTRVGSTAPTPAMTTTPPPASAGELADRLSLMGARVLIETLARLGTLSPIPQGDAEATLAPRLRKVDGRVDWREPAPAIVGRVHGCNPWPGAATEAPAGRLTIWRARAVPRESDGGTPGTLVEAGGGVVVIAGVGAVEPTLVQPESRRTVTWPEYLRGARLRAGDRLTAR